MLTVHVSSIADSVLMLWGRRWDRQVI